MTTYGRDEQPWPKLDPAAIYGPLGDFVRAASPHTEADPAALLGVGLAYVGLALGEANVYLRLGDARHGPSLYVAVIGRTAKARKGTASRQVSPAVVALDPEFEERHRVGGFGSGEALIMTIASTGRVLIEEQELTQCCRVAAREGSTLGQIIRLGWNGAPLERRTVKETTLVSGRYGLAIVGHATVEELRGLISSGDIYGGTINRFLWFCAQRSRLHPDGGNVPVSAVNTLLNASPRPATRSPRRSTGQEHGVVALARPRRRHRVEAHLRDARRRRPTGSARRCDAVDPRAQTQRLALNVSG